MISDRHFTTTVVSTILMTTNSDKLTDRKNSLCLYYEGYHDIVIRFRKKLPIYFMRQESVFRFSLAFRGCSVLYLSKGKGN
jgi:hypothetical protein